ncbi:MULTISPECIES: type VI secretion system baseplate subunit TssG [unclassified Motilimonas]|uniref:type VI secretion system baseplate subunit TssG n=1 Tax=unclassified Motilimonas TaxID=2643697 RepID=UPI001E46E1F9|nr:MULTISPECIES: type VI secretion system baseplate subunit TssG [unclassified Motilimonas]MCE0559219.1 type VI secretion system baseplate subunit TssG [Motilimonas sp. E26]MDO6527520.1 type VI secretion system baseplate subunit TssG [Motilimonas sp. 1_MG-2023]
MECTSGSATTDLTIADLFANNIREYSFFQLVELLQKLQKESDFEVFYAASKSLGFACADITSLSAIKNSPNKFKLETCFLGLNGAQSPLPNYYLDELACEPEAGIKHVLFDFFNDRLMTLLHQAWRKYRYYVQFEADAQDKFSAQLFSLVGLSDPAMRGQTPINWCKMLAYSGMLAGKSRSSLVVAGIVAHCFDLDDVEVDQWQLRSVRIPDDQQFLLGQQGASLGEDTVIGEKVADRGGKFTLKIGGLSRQRFKDFLPSGVEFDPLCKLIEFVLREQLAYDLSLQLAPDEITAFKVGDEKSAYLGWSAFLGKVNTDRSVLIQVRA